MDEWRWHAGAAALAAALWFTGVSPLHAQASLPAPSPPSESQTSPTTDALAAEIRRLQRTLEDLQTSLADSRRQTAALQQALQDLRDQIAEERELLVGQMSTLEQAKVESGSLYRVRLFGMVLMQLVSTRGAVDNIDLPNLAVESVAGDSGGNISAAVRQSFLGVAVFGPTLAGAQTSARLSVDFFGGFPAANDGLSAPGVRLRTLALALEGKRTSFRAGQEAPFFSPLSPTSLASTAYPALSSVGNLWAWTPEVYVERRLDRPGRGTVMWQAGLLDALTGELPAGEYSRLATAGERSRTPATAGRVAWRRNLGEGAPAAGGTERMAAAGAGAYYARQNWGFDRTVNAWAMTADWEMPLSSLVTASGELYRGQAIGGLGGGAHSSVLFDGAPTDARSTVHPLISTGGWAQVKLKRTARLEFNGAFGLDRSRPHAFSGLLEPPSDEAPSASRNTSGFVNVIYQARSNIFFSVEYRRLWSTRLDGRGWLADHLNLGGGIAF